MSGYTKLFSDIITSSVWNEDDKTRIVWITLLALSDATGYVHCALPSLALMARMDQGNCESSLKKLSAPDEYSRTPDNHGIRISKIDGGWMILNYEKHRNRLSNDSEAASGRERVRKYRERHKNVTCNVTGCNTASASDLNSSLSDSEAFSEFWKLYPRRVGKGAAEKAFKHYKCGKIIDLIKIAIENQLRSKQWRGGFIPNPATWLNQKRWLDEVDSTPPSQSPSPPDPKKSFTKSRDEIIAKLEEANKAGGDSVSRELSACNDTYRDIPKQNGEQVVDEAYKIFQFRKNK